MQNRATTISSRNLLLAALGAEGVTLLRDPGHIPRGYADLPGDLRTLGADCITEKT